jgi:carbonic anhydrase
MSQPLIAWQNLRAGNESFTGPVPGYHGANAARSPSAVVFGCADAAVCSETILGQPPGSLINVCTWGHVIDSGVLATLEYAVGELAVPLILVLGHADCHAMATATRAWNDADMPEGTTRVMVEQAMGSIVRRGARADSVEDVNCAHVVETGLGLLERSPLVARQVDCGACGIVCATTVAGSGRLRVYATVGAVGEVPDSLLECV